MSDLVKRLWTCSVRGVPRGLALAREPGSIAVWDDADWLTLIDDKGRLQGQRHHSSPIQCASISDDGSRIIVADGKEVSWLSPDLSVTASAALPSPALALCVDVSGDYTVVSEKAGRMTLWDRSGREVQEWPLPRPAKFLGLVSSVPHVLAAADYGFLGRLDLSSNAWAWQQRPVVHQGSLSTDGEGTKTVIASFSEGVKVHGAEGELLSKTSPFSKPIKLAVISAISGLIVALGVDHQLSAVRFPHGKSYNLPVEEQPSHLALSSEGSTVYLTSSDRKVSAYSLSHPSM